MTKTDFVAIQTAINDARGAVVSYGPAYAVGNIFDSMSRDIAKVLAKQNPKFKRTEFLKGCGVL